MCSQFEMSYQTFDRGLFNEGTVWDDFSFNPTRRHQEKKAERADRIRFFTDSVHGATRQMQEAGVRGFLSESCLAEG